METQARLKMMDNYRRITSDLLRERLRKGEATLILDLREPPEFEEQHIANSLNIPLEMLNVENFLKEQSRGPIYLACTTGKKAYKAADMFYEAGCTDIVILAGGLLSWRALGFPLTRKAGK